MMIVHTPRLRLRPLRLGDADVLAECLADWPHDEHGGQAGGRAVKNAYLRSVETMATLLGMPIEPHAAAQGAQAGRVALIGDLSDGTYPGACYIWYSVTGAAGDADRHCVFHVVALSPYLRGRGLYSELRAALGKLAFDYYGCATDSWEILESASAVMADIDKGMALPGNEVARKPHAGATGQQLTPVHMTAAEFRKLLTLRPGDAAARFEVET